MNRSRFRLLLITGFLALWGIAAKADSGLHAGAAAVNIDPPKLPVIRNGGFIKNMGSKISQSLFARSLVLESNGERIAICVVDTCMLDRELCDQAKTLVTEQTGLPEDRILISATHTHTAPSAMRCLGCPVDPEYPDFLIPKIVSSIEQATLATRPAECGWAVADAGKFTNTRRWIYLSHKTRVDPYGNKSIRAMMHPGHVNPDTAGPSGPEDPSLTLLSIRDRDGKPLAVLGNLSQHYYAKGELSSGFTGTVCHLLEKEFGGKFIGLMSQGTSGDLQHIDYSLPKAEGAFVGKGDPYDAYCRELTDLALEALTNVVHRSDHELGMVEAKLTLGRRLPDAKRIAWAKPIVEKLGDDLPGDRTEVLANEVVWIQENPEEELKLQAIRIGDFGIAAMPNEVYGLTGLKLKVQSPLSTLMNIELANGAAGYIPPPEQHHLGGYTTWPARTAGLEVEAEPKIVETLLTSLEEVSGKTRRKLRDQVGDHGAKIAALKPTASWRMGEHSGASIPDASGNGHAGKLEPGYALFLDGPAESEGKILSAAHRNRAVHFAGGRMIAEAPKLNRGSDYSVSLWFWNAMPSDARPVTGYFFGLGSDGDGTACEQFGLSGQSLGKPGRLLFYNGDSERDVVVGETELKLQHWHHLLISRQGDTVSLFLDGASQPEIEARITDTRPHKDTQLFVGGRSDGKFNFEGKIDEVALYDRALTALENPGLAQKVPKKPNILFIGVDDLRPELNCYGSTHILSPHIDRLADEGVLFTRAYCQWAVCMPSRASLLTGLRPGSFGGKANGFRSVVPDVVTLPQHFKNHGYFTQSIGKIFHGAWETAYVGNAFQDPESWSAKRWAASPQYYFSPEGMAEANKVFATASPKALFLGEAVRDPDKADQWKDFFVRAQATEAPDVPDDVPADGQIAQAAIKRMRTLASEENPPPFFLAVGFQKPHLPFVAPKKYWDLYDPETIPPVAVPNPPEGVPTFALSVGANELNQYLPKTRGAVSPDRTRHLRHGYAACVSYVDAQVGLLLDELSTLGIRDNTIVVLWSDHGYKLGDFGAWAKHTNFELDTRVPLIVSAPGLPQRRRSEAVVELVDLHPTLSELAALPIHPGADGESFAESIRNPEAAGQVAAYSQYPRGGYIGYSVRNATHRYTEWRDEKSGGGKIVATELYEYGEEGIERVNLAGRPEHDQVQSALAELLRD